MPESLSLSTPDEEEQAFFNSELAHHPSALPNGSVGKESACKEGDPGSISVLERSPEKGMDTHSSILAWRIPWTEEPGELQSMELQRVGHS